ncbi:MAG: hypothetical protein JSS94_09510 [Bacteroidetes bacterium]|nr:hypothetical protein [Bacteroidota bacterium]
MNLLFNPKEEIRFNEVIFRNRNKNYGAYVLRSEESKMLWKALFVGSVLVMILTLIPKAVSYFQPIDRIVEDPITGIVWKDIPDLPIERKSELKSDFIHKKSSNDASVNWIPKKNLQERNVEKMEITEFLPLGNKGNGITEVTSSTIVSGNGTSVHPTEQIRITPPKELKTLPDDPFTNVEVEAEFSGGINAFRQLIRERFDGTAFEDAEDVLKATVTFVVEKDGRISSIIVKGNNENFNKEAARTIRSIQQYWTPAKVGGHSVRSYFSFPISMQFD